jgi:hypothetical protein
MFKIPKTQNANSATEKFPLHLSLCAGLAFLFLSACGNSEPLPTSVPSDKDTSSSVSETLIPRSAPGDKGKYFLVYSEKVGGIIKATHKRVGVDSVGFTKTETNCGSMQMREIGYSEVGAQDIKNEPTKWFDLVDGSSKSDLAMFLCSRN